jgi:gamma-glutamylcyclotransferase (GGCT)/AIG2-like uncharacterized protein YtfP
MSEIICFVYGSLKCGYANARFCKKATRIEKSTVCGKVYQLSAGFPALKIPKESIIDYGSDDLTFDAICQCDENDYGALEFRIYDGWDTVHGELVTFDNPNLLKPIDRLEGFPVFYNRVLVPVKKEDGAILAAYVYIMEDIHSPARYLPNGVWPENRKSKLMKGVEKCAMTN